MEGLSEFWSERFAAITDDTPFIFLSHAQDSLRDVEATQTGAIVRALEQLTGCVDIPLYGRIPHNADGRLFVHSAAEMQFVREKLTAEQLEVLRAFLIRGACICLGNEPAKLLKPLLGKARWTQHNKQLRHPDLWSHGKDAKNYQKVVLDTLAPLAPAGVLTAEKLDEIIRTSENTPKRKATRQETYKHTGKLLHGPATEAQRAQGRAVGLAHGGRTRDTPTDAQREASSAVGKRMGYLKVTGEGRRKCANTALATMQTEEGQVRQSAKGSHMAAVRDEAATQAAANAAKAARKEEESQFRLINEADLREQVANGATCAELVHRYLVPDRYIREHIMKIDRRLWPATRHKAEQYDVSHEATQEFMRRLAAMGFDASRIAMLHERPLATEEVAAFLGIPCDGTPKAPVRWSSGREAWLSDEDLKYLCDRVPDTKRLAHCLQHATSKGGRSFWRLWEKFLIDFKATGAGEHPLDIPDRTAKKRNTDLKMGIDRDVVDKAHNEKIHAAERALKEEKMTLKRKRREEEDATAREALRMRKAAPSSVNKVQPLAA